MFAIQSSGTDFPDSTTNDRGRYKFHGDVPAVTLKPEWTTASSEKDDELESGQLSGRVVASNSLEEMGQGHQEHIHILHEMEEGECTPTMSSHSLSQPLYPSAAVHKERGSSGALPSHPSPPVVEKTSSMLSQLLRMPSRTSVDQVQCGFDPSKKETGSSISTIGGGTFQAEAAAPVVSQPSLVVQPPPAAATSTPTSNIVQSPSLSVTHQPQFGRGLLHLIGTSSSSLYSSSTEGPLPSVSDAATQDSSMRLLSSSDVPLDKVGVVFLFS